MDGVKDTLWKQILCLFATVNTAGALNTGRIIGHAARAVHAVLPP